MNSNALNINNEFGGESDMSRIDRFKEVMENDKTKECISFTGEMSKTGRLCLWEKGGSYAKYGLAILTSDKWGNPKVPIYVNRRGNLACAEHALVPVNVHDIIVLVKYCKDEDALTLFVCRVKFVDKFKRKFRTTIINRYVDGEWEKGVEGYKNLIDTAISKVKTYHCREAMYIDLNDEVVE